MLITCALKIEGSNHTVLKGNLILRSTTNSQRQAILPWCLFAALYGGVFIKRKINFKKSPLYTSFQWKIKHDLGQCQKNVKTVSFLYIMYLCAVINPYTFSRSQDFI